MSLFSCRCPSPSGLLFRHSLAMLLALLLVAWGDSARAASDADEAELRLLPRYCPDTMNFTKYGDSSFNTSPRAGYWVSLMGKSFWHMHHYCGARLNMNRAQKAKMDQSMRQTLWRNAQDNYQYVIKNSEPDFIMLPEVYTRMGEVELLLGAPDKANEAFARARQLKPDYWPAYSYWAEFLMKHGKRPEALRVVGSGLQHAPTAKVLLEQFRILGGKPSDIPSKPVSKSEEMVDNTAKDKATEPGASGASETNPVPGESAHRENE